ncbi:DUF817 domain-containing protein [Microvirga sp. ACRRW]|uniref:DUF817 domain-containing protein n=1 Tax=Microvirga sp. ACRRW TaxID=2918205 RepID=UPI001EF51448|nr:DUF817 domain-containing protein [Microvirga sp. ACRRW]MCG7393482.1 DUF817 domain-containing protein [Microvirga sp. ACRRW]
MLFRDLNLSQRSSAKLWPFTARFIAAEEGLARSVETKGPWVSGLYEFLRFGIKQGWACLFGGLMVALLIATKLWYPASASLERYDFLFIAAILIQGGLIVTRLETLEEAKVILLFHVVGTLMEIFKTSVGSWAYPEASLFRIGGAPLFAGFMYAAVGSYLARVWRLFDFRFTHHPPVWAAILLSVGIYVNFFTHHYTTDFRLVLFCFTALLFGRTNVYFKVWRVHRRMPLLLGFLLVSLFIWFAENIGTITGAWLYPHQLKGWSMVPFTKLGAWFLLMIISYVMIAALNRPQPFTIEKKAQPASQPEPARV